MSRSLHRTLSVSRLGGSDGILDREQLLRYNVLVPCGEIPQGLANYCADLRNRLRNKGSGEGSARSSELLVQTRVSRPKGSALIFLILV